MSLAKKKYLFLQTKQQIVKANVIIGSLDRNTPGKLFLLTSEELDKAYHQIGQYIYNVRRKMVLLLPKNNGRIAKDNKRFGFKNGPR